MTDQQGEPDMDPIAAAALARTASSAGDAAGKEAVGLFSRLLGPSADVIGEAMAQWTKARLRNVGRIAERADEKVGRDAGGVPPRVAHRILEDGSFADDEVMVEYLSGVLAASRTPDGRDDRGAVWASMVTGMSTFEVRAHFLIYREWAAGLRGSGLDVADGDQRHRAEMQLDGNELVEAIAGVPGEDELHQYFWHALHGLRRRGLLDDGFRIKVRDEDAPDLIFGAVLELWPTPSGVELYGWALGDSEMSSERFAEGAKVIGEDTLPRLHGVQFPNLEPVEENSIPIVMPRD